MNVLEDGFYNMDCMDGMKQFPDKYFDLAIVDPPYFKGPDKRGYYGSSVSASKVKRKVYPELENWGIPDSEYFNELIRVSKEQIVWGCNYFNFEFGSGRIVWDKVNGQSSFSDCELAYCSIHNSIRLFRYMWNGMMQGKSLSEGHIVQGNKGLNEKRIHPTQKPVVLYDWIVLKYTKPGFRVLDTHVGSASSLIAYEKARIKYVGFEIDENMYKLASERLEEEQSQITLINSNSF